MLLLLFATSIYIIMASFCQQPCTWFFSFAQSFVSLCRTHTPLSQSAKASARAQSTTYAGHKVLYRGERIEVHTVRIQSIGRIIKNAGCRLRRGMYAHNIEDGRLLISAISGVEIAKVSVENRMDVCLYWFCPFPAFSVGAFMTPG